MERWNFKSKGKNEYLIELLGQLQKKKLITVKMYREIGKISGDSK